MKYLWGIVVIIYFLACSEVPVTLPGPPDAGSGKYAQRVLIEEYTGVRCQNCPAGARLLDDLKNIHGDKLVAISVHGGFFAQPTNRENKFSLDNNFGKELIRIYNEPQGYPSAIINRKSFDGSLFIGGNSWAGYINSELKNTPEYGIDLNVTKTVSNRKISVECIVTGLKNLTAPALSLSIILIENNIVDAQLTPTGVDVNYTHNHVLRSFLTGVQGEVLPPIGLNKQETRLYQTTISDNWNIDRIKVIALLHKTEPVFEMVQVIEN